TQSCRQPDEQHSRKIVSSIEVSGVPDFTKDRDQWLHHGSPESGKPSSESTFYFMAIQLYSDAIPLALSRAGGLDHAPPGGWVSLRPRGPRSGPGYSVPVRRRLIGPIRPARGRISISPHSGL